MRLLDTFSFEFKEFFDSQIPKYAILSHRWGDEEVTFQDFRKGKKRDSQGFAKINRCCMLAASRGFQWVWIDTCCIDKKSSAELTEAINSMCRWYQGAGECYAYLSDVVWKPWEIEESKKAFRQSLWFTRGWTLQELLAPHDVVFFDRQWSRFGTKFELATEILAATGIKYEHMIVDALDWNGACVATKMSWASKRVTSRVEDVAYCMMGLFGVNMPLLYGEGKKAFIRLQLEIIKKSNDESIFAWTSPALHSGMLASQPSYFAESGQIRTSLRVPRSPYVMTNQGLAFHVPVPKGKTWVPSAKNLLSTPLNCLYEGPKGLDTVDILIGRFGNSWQRYKCDELFLRELASVSMDYDYDERNNDNVVIYIDQLGL